MYEKEKNKNNKAIQPAQLQYKAITGDCQRQQKHTFAHLIGHSDLHIPYLSVFAITEL